MKNFNFLRFAAVFSIFAILLSSCSKDSLSKPSTQISKQRTTNDPLPIAGTGSIQATISSSTATSTSMIAYNDDDGSASAEVFTDSNGYVIINDLLPGTYTVVAHAYTSPPDPTYATNDLTTDVTITIKNVIVVADQVTDLGKIIFPN